MTDFASFQSRIASLREQEKNLNWAEEIAASGFYEYENELYVVCFSCNLKIKKVDLKENPDKVHKELEPDCSFVRRDLLERTSTELVNPEHPEFASYESRIKTFKDWPISVVTPLQLSKAGFFYEGNADKVKCYHCGVSLNHWEEGDDPLLEHIKLEPDCYFPRHIKGKEYVEKIMAIKNQEEPNEQQDICDELDSEDNCSEEDENCKVCLINPCNVLLSPCGHSFCCYCSFEIINCPLCRSDILKLIKPEVFKCLKVD